MAARLSSTQCKRVDRIGTVGQIRTPDKKVKPISGATVRVITNRYSGLEAEVVKHHNTYRVGDRLTIAESDFVAG